MIHADYLCTELLVVWFPGRILFNCHLENKAAVPLQATAHRFFAASSTSMFHMSLSLSSVIAGAASAMFLGYIAIAISCLWFARQASAGFQQVELFKCHVKSLESLKWGQAEKLWLSLGKWTVP